jgi:2-oxoglutarate ferredoxin oxidoreductase subunit alpha
MAQSQQTETSLSIALVGSGGAGVMTAGSLLLEAAANAGWYGLMTRSVGPQIRGGEAAALVKLSTTPTCSASDRFDILLGIDWKNADRFAGEIPLTPQSVILGDAKAGDPPQNLAASGARVHTVPLTSLAGDITGGRPNMIALGLVAALAGIDQENVVALLAKKLARKGEAAIKASTQAIAAGYKAASAIPSPCAAPTLEAPQKGRWMINGNQAAGLGALRGGVRFVAAYPITPATEILEWMAPNLARLGGTLVQAEDELASINMAIGASYGGIPSLTATSGPGLALMMEGLGLSVGSEVPVVVVDVMRGGPSTGIPTKSEQSDLNIAIYGFHGDAPHVVVAPTSVADCLFTVQWAVHLAEALQSPAIVLSDQFLGQASAIVDPPADLTFFARRKVAEEPDETFQRYAVTADGISPMSIPGTPGGQYTADGLEHNPRGTPSSQATDHALQMDKRAHKITAFDYGDHWADIDGEGELAIITWGSLTSTVREALGRLADDDVSVRLIAMRLLSPIQQEKLAAALDGVSRVLIIEQTHGGQFHHYLQGHYDLPGDVKSFHRPGPTPLRTAEIVEFIKNWSDQ